MQRRHFAPRLARLVALLWLCAYGGTLVLMIAIALLAP